MVWTERTSFMYFIGGVLPGVAAISRHTRYWIIVGIVWMIIILGLFYWRSK